MPHAARTIRNRDPGLQPERTGLAWSRSSLAMFVVGLLILRTAFVAESVSALIGGALSMGMSVFMVIRAEERPRYDALGEEVTTPVSMRFMIGTTAVVLAISVLEFVRIILRMLLDLLFQ